MREQTGCKPTRAAHADSLKQKCPFEICVGNVSEGMGSVADRQLPGREMFLVPEIPSWLLMCSRHAAHFYAPSLLCSCCALPFRVKSTAVRSGRDESHVILYYHSCERGLRLQKSCSALDTHGKQVYALYKDVEFHMLVHPGSYGKNFKLHEICSAFDTSSKSRFS